MELKRVAVITGAASGIGLALARSCLKRGFNVVMADNRAENLEVQASLLASEFPNAVLPLSCDVCKLEDMLDVANKTVSHFHQIDWLFNNAGISGKVAPVWELEDKDLRQVMDINLYGAFYGIKAFLPQMFKQKSPSHIINIASLYGLCASSQMTAYTLSKHALVALSESLYFDLQACKAPISVSVACPSFVNTQLMSYSRPDADNNLHSLMDDLIGRSRPAEDVAESIVKSVLQNKFYIFPDEEVKAYFQQRSTAIVEEQPPYKHAIEKIINKLRARVEKA